MPVPGQPEVVVLEPRPHLLPDELGYLVADVLVEEDLAEAGPTTAWRETALRRFPPGLSRRCLGVHSDPDLRYITA